MIQINNPEEFRKVGLEIKETEYVGVIYRRHQNPDGSVGGFVADTAKVDKTCFIGHSVLVYDNARVFGDAQVYGDV